MASYNRVVLLGNLTRDVELKYLPSGTAVADIGLAVNDRRKNQAGEWVDEPTFVDITLWGRTAEVAERVPGEGVFGLDRGPVEAGYLGDGRAEAVEAEGYRREDADGGAAQQPRAARGGARRARLWSAGHRIRHAAAGGVPLAAAGG